MRPVDFGVAVFPLEQPLRPVERDSMPTPMPQEHEIERQWMLVDATDQVLGRLATRVATILRGKHKPTYAPHLDVGDHVIVINAERIHLTGKKLRDKQYRWHTGYIGGLREVSAETMLRTHPERVIEGAVQGTVSYTHLTLPTSDLV